ncbi:MAG: TonB family protein [Flavobacteriales bacterium]|nr:TonB family protein [Flavobacteriales bacterium]
MKTIQLILFFSLFISLTNYSSASKTNQIKIEKANLEEDKKAQFPGGKEKMNEWIKDNLRTPKENIRYGIVRIEFTVKKNGRCTNYTIKKGLNEDMDFSAVECLQGMPIWEPAIKDGKKVNSIVVIPVKFSGE